MAVTVSSIGTANPEPTGKKLDTVTVTTTEGTVHREGVFIGDPQTPANRATVSAAGEVSVLAAALPLPTGASTETTLATRLDAADFDTKIGALTEAAPASDTASSGLNGRLQRIAQRLSSLIALLPTALVGNRLDINLGSWLGSTAPTVGSKTSANSVPVVIASDQATFPVTASAGTNLNTSALALEAGGNLAAIKADADKIPSQGQALAAASMPVVLTAIQVTTLTPPAAITGFALDATVAKDATLTTIDTDIKAAQPRKIQDTSGGSITVGQKAMAASLPMTLATDQPAVPISATALPLPTGAPTESGGNLAKIATADDALLSQILIELRIMNHILQLGLGVGEQAEGLRASTDPLFSPLVN